MVLGEGGGGSGGGGGGGSRFCFCFKTKYYLCIIRVSRFFFFFFFWGGLASKNEAGLKPSPGLVAQLLRKIHLFRVGVGLKGSHKDNSWGRPRHILSASL